VKQEAVACGLALLVQVDAVESRFGVVDAPLKTNRLLETQHFLAYLLPQLQPAITGSLCANPVFCVGRALIGRLGAAARVAAGLGHHR
jgi:hypothetical protein